MIPNLPITVDLSLDNSKNEFSFEIQVSECELEVSTDPNDREPIEVELTLDNSKNEFDFEVLSNKYEFEISTGTAIIIHKGDTEKYEGPYEVDPLVKNQIVLETTDKYCDKNITINKVPRYSTSNTYGTTFYIGEV